MVGRPHAGLCRSAAIRTSRGRFDGRRASAQGSFRSRHAQATVSDATEKGLDTYNGIVAMSEGRIRTAIYLGGNLYSANPDLEFAARAMQRVENAVYISTKHNPGHVHGRGQRTLVLPARTRDEELQATTQESMFNYVRWSVGGERADSPEMRSEVDIVASLAARVLPRPHRLEALKSHCDLRQEIARVVPGYAAVAAMDATKQDFTIAGRVRHTPEFATADGRARFHVTPLPSEPLAAGELRLMTLRSEGQFNTVVYEYQDIYRGADGRDVVFMSAADAHRLNLHAGERVELISETGRYGPVRVLITDIRPGNIAAYYPEANVLVPRRIDARSLTPAFKSVVVRVARAAERPGALSASEPRAPGPITPIVDSSSCCWFKPRASEPIDRRPLGIESHGRAAPDRPRQLVPAKAGKRSCPRAAFEIGPAPVPRTSACVARVSRRSGAAARRRSRRA